MIRHRALPAFFLGLILIAAVLLFRFSNSHAVNQAHLQEIARSFQVLENETGYGGFIHNFKNSILRPEESIYAERALVNYQAASAELIALQGFAQEAGVELDVASLQSTLDLYRDALDLARAAHLGGASVQEVDRLVRISDDEAHLNLLELRRRVELLLNDRLRTSQWRLNTSLIVIGLLMVGLMGVGGVAVYQRQAKYELQQKELEREQAHAARQSALVVELQRSNRELDEFAYTASHDLKEPLRGIAINANFLSREEVSDKGRERIERMVALTKRMEQLISDILFFSRLGRGGGERREIDPAQIVADVIGEMREWITERGANVRVETAMPLLHAEPSKVKTVFRNLIANGLKYNDSQEKSVDVGFLQEVVIKGETFHNVFYVRDNGIGIETRNHEKIFRLFQRLNLEADFGPGTGAGLSFVRKIIEDYGQRITLTSVPGEGTTFYFTLPPAVDDVATYTKSENIQR